MRKLIYGVILITGSALLATMPALAKHKDKKNAAGGAFDCNYCHTTLKIAKKKGFEKFSIPECAKCHPKPAAKK